MRGSDLGGEWSSVVTATDPHAWRQNRARHSGSLARRWPAVCQAMRPWLGLCSPSLFPPRAPEPLGAGSPPARRVLHGSTGQGLGSDPAWGPWASSPRLNPTPLEGATWLSFPKVVLSEPGHHLSHRIGRDVCHRQGDSLWHPESEPGLEPRLSGASPAVIFADPGLGAQAAGKSLPLLTQLPRAQVLLDPEVEGCRQGLALHQPRSQP